MENEEKQLTQEESLQIIHNMISAAKNDVKADAFIFLLWGYLVFIASISQFILAQMNIENNDAVWLLMPIGAVITIVYSIRQNKKERTKTHVSEFLKYIWIAFVAAMGVIMFFHSWGHGQILPLIMTLYGIGLFISGGALKFTPLIVGGIFCWICAIAGFKVEVLYQLPIIAAAVLGGYIIPGHLLKLNNRK
jgi:uncharacterized membrane protein